VTRELEAQYAALIATADEQATIGELVAQIREDKRLDNRERNALWTQATNRHNELGRTSFERGLAKEVAAPAPVDNPTSTGGELVVPIASPAQARAAWDAYVAMAQALEDPADVVEIEGKRFRRKSFWRKVALAYGISVELVNQLRAVEGDPAGVRTAFYVQVRASSKTGRHVDGVASCSSREPGRTSALEHVLYATAYTRAANRAIADLVAAGEVSAEEVE